MRGEIWSINRCSVCEMCADLDSRSANEVRRQVKMKRQRMCFKGLNLMTEVKATPLCLFLVYTRKGKVVCVLYAFHCGLD
jgi:hypothetical protein